MMCAQTFLKTPLCKLWRVDAFLVSGFFHSCILKASSEENGYKFLVSGSSPCARAYAKIFFLRVQGCRMPINTGLAPYSEGCQGCHKGVTGDPNKRPTPTLPV